MKNFVDLHIHSTASDSSTAPQDIIGKVLETVEKHGDYYEHYYIALTDHDTTSGVRALQEAAKSYPNFTVFPGVEISCMYEDKKIHIVGLNVNPNDPDLTSTLQYYRGKRESRNSLIIEKFKEYNIDIPLETIQVEEGKSSGRPLIAKWLFENGYVKSINDAFDKYIGQDKPCYVARELPNAEKAIQLILNAGGIPVLAHPMQYKKFSREALEEMIVNLKAYGLKRVEAFYTEFSDEERNFVLELATKHELEISGGSDYHGSIKPTYELGYGWGNLAKTMGLIKIPEK